MPTSIEKLLTWSEIDRIKKHLLNSEVYIIYDKKKLNTATIKAGTLLYEVNYPDDYTSPISLAKDIKELISEKAKKNGKFVQIAIETGKVTVRLLADY